MFRRAWQVSLVLMALVGAARAETLVPFEQPGWFSVGIPQGWQPYGDPKTGHVAIGNPDGRSAHFWLLMVPNVVDAEGAASLFLSLTAQITRSQWSRPVVKSEGNRLSVTSQAHDGPYLQVGGLSLVRAGNVTVAFFTMATGVEATFAENRDLFAAIFASFRPVGAKGGGRAGPALAYQPWSDPNEHAFTLEVPQGWTIQGGTARGSAVDVRQAIQAVSPDRSILIQAGDTELPPFVEPWGMLQEGQYNGPALVRRYTPGAYFARDYLAFRVQPQMRDLTIDVARPIPELQQLVQASIDAYPTPGIERHVDIGEVIFHGTWNGKPAHGYLYASTSRTAQSGGGAMWFAGDLSSLVGFIATDDQIPAAVEALGHMRQTFQLDPAWAQAQHMTVAAVSKITEDTNAYISNIINQSFATNQRTNDSIFDQYQKQQRDILDVTDVNTQQKYEVQAGANYYWIDDRGLILGTEDPFNPDPGWFREMLVGGQ